jgi:exodeoxyribonuclease V alpha subunit
MMRLLERLARYGDIGWLAYHFAEFIADSDSAAADDVVLLTAAMLCEANRNGDVCIELGAAAGKPMLPGGIVDAGELPVAPDLAAWRARLLTSSCVAGPDQRAPLTLENDRLYLNRFWHYEHCVADALERLLMRGTDIDRQSVEQLFDRLFATSEALDEGQRDAVLGAASRSFSVISGGPGSGKTSCVVRIIALLLAQNPDCRIALAAPTGKAAARMMESIRQGIQRLDIDESIRRAVPDDAQTLHRLLGYRNREFSRGAGHPLAEDCVIVDEASMIDLKLMHHLVGALSESARLILLGDRDQLASVAAGNVLGDITGHGHDLDATTAPIAKSVSLLSHNYRFGTDSPIGQLAAQVNNGQAAAALEALSRDQVGLHWYQQPGDQLDAAALEWACSAYAAIFDCRDPGQALDVFERSRVLCATNQGPLGVEAVGNQIGERLLASAGLAAADLYHGLPIMITRNRHELGLYNGDSGILWRDGGQLRACFRDSGGIRLLALNRLPEFTPAWASTVHKAQGSEYDSVLLVLSPDAESEVLTRELLYTAITRARLEFRLHSPRAGLMHAVESLSRRHAGLADKLGWSV